MKKAFTLSLLALSIAQSPAYGASATSFPPRLTASCTAVVSNGLANVANAFLAGDDHLVLASSLRAERTARTCGAEREAVSFELIAADAFADLNDAKGRCGALRDALRRIVRFPERAEVARAAMVRRAVSSCRP